MAEDQSSFAGRVRPGRPGRAAGRDAASGILRRTEESLRASYVELFFDLAFIFAFARLSRFLVDNPTVTGGLEMFLLLAAVWWIWAVTAWSSDWFSPTDRYVQRVFAWVMFGGLLMAAAVPHAYGPSALLFAGAYVAVHLGRGAALIYKLRQPGPRVRSARVAFWFLATGVLWIVGAVLGPARYSLWAAAIAVDAAVGLAGYPVPRLGHSRQEELRVAGEHFAERWGQMFIVSIGEFILVTGFAYGGGRHDAPHTVAFALAFLNAFLVTRTYHLPASRGVAEAIDDSRQPGRVGLAVCYVHLLLLAGVLVTAAGNEMIIAAAGGRASWDLVAVPLTGTALVLLGRALFALVTGQRPRWPLVAGAVVVLAATPATLALPPPATTGVTVLVLFLACLAHNARSGRGRAPGGSGGTGVRV